MLGIKFTAYGWTNSTAILSDAAESIVHIMAVLFAAYSLRLSAKPADSQHPYGHAKVSFFSAGVEGTLILVAAGVIIFTAVMDWLSGLELRNLDLGVALTAAAALINAGLGWYLIRVGRRRRSIILEANGYHVLTDCWTSIGVIAGLALAWSTGWLILDPICAILVALNIIYSGVRLIQRSIGGLMDEADPVIHKKINDLLEEFKSRRLHIAIVVDEYGGMDGIVTMEDIIETLLGFEIIDEKDTVYDMQQLAKERRNVLDVRDNSSI
jgi:cation diffusion facilitator family transporter